MICSEVLSEHDKLENVKRQRKYHADFDKAMLFCAGKIMVVA